MYQRYKIKKKDRKFLKFFILLLFLSVVTTLGYQYRTTLLFWKYTENKIVKKLKTSISIKGKKERILELKKTVDVLEQFKKDNPLDVKSYFLLAKSYFLLGENSLPGTFCEYIINDKDIYLSKKNKYYFIQTLQNIRKGFELDETKKKSKEYLFFLAKASFYLDYYSKKYILKILEDGNFSTNHLSIDNARFYAILKIINGKEDEGVKIVKFHGDVSDSIEGKLFLATVEKMSKKYTDSILHFRELLTIEKDKNIIKLIDINLGKIYYNRSLFRESLFYFTEATKLDKSDNLLKIWIGKSYFAMGYKAKAKAIWSQVLVSDNGNNEVKKLLNVL